jgi:hypothetical protein
MKQLFRWMNARPTESQKAELLRLSRQMERLWAGLASALTMADEMKELCPLGKVNAQYQYGLLPRGSWCKLGISHNNADVKR